MEVKSLKERGLLEVESFTHAGEFYLVDLIEKTCTCPAHKFRGIYCKHIKLAEQAMENRWSRQILSNPEASTYLNLVEVRK